MKTKWVTQVELPNEGGWTEWIHLAKKHRIACCDCGLVHDLEYSIDGDALHFRAKRNNRSTGQMRRHRA